MKKDYISNFEVFPWNILCSTNLLFLKGKEREKKSLAIRVILTSLNSN